MADNWKDAVEEHRDTLEALAAADVDLQLVDDTRRLLELAEEESDG